MGVQHPALETELVIGSLAREGRIVVELVLGLWSPGIRGVGLGIGDLGRHAKINFRRRALGLALERGRRWG